MGEANQSCRGFLPAWKERRFRPAALRKHVIANFFRDAAFVPRDEAAYGVQDALLRAKKNFRRQIL
jgi:hypothetical protein